jgi:hypothetical protein
MLDKKRTILIVVAGLTGLILFMYQSFSDKGSFDKFDFFAIITSTILFVFFVIFLKKKYSK